MPAPLASFVSVPRGADGEMGAYLSRPAHPRAALVVIQEIFGVNAAMRAIADDFAAEGFAALVPDIFWRLERRVELGNGEDEPKRKIAIDLMNRFDVARGVSDLSAAADWLRAQNLGGGRVGVVGFCLGGRLAALVASRGRIDAAAAFYGVGLERNLDDVAAIAAPVQFHFGAEDNQIPPATIEKVRDALAGGRAPRREVFVYPGAQHAFYNSHRKDRFHPAARDLARERTLDHFRRSLS
jgi:carboxymethylenebutenolidase